MDPAGRVERDPRSEQQAFDEPRTGGQWDSPASRGQGQWEGKSRADFTATVSCHVLRMYSRPLSYYFSILHFLDVDDTGLGQQQRSDVRGQGVGQFSSGEGFAPDETGGSADLRTAQAERDDDRPIGAGQGGKPSVASRAMGASFSLRGWSVLMSRAVDRHSREDGGKDYKGSGQASPRRRT
jgi:hypothetical protein